MIETNIPYNAPIEHVVPEMIQNANVSQMPSNQFIQSGQQFGQTQIPVHNNFPINNMQQGQMNYPTQPLQGNTNTHLTPQQKVQKTYYFVTDKFIFNRDTLYSILRPLIQKREQLIQNNMSADHLRQVLMNNSALLSNIKLSAAINLRTAHTNIGDLENYINSIKGNTSINRLIKSHDIKVPVLDSSIVNIREGRSSNIKIIVDSFEVMKLEELLAQYPQYLDQEKTNDTVDDDIIRVLNFKCVDPETHKAEVMERVQELGLLDMSIETLYQLLNEQKQ